MTKRNLASLWIKESGPNIWHEECKRKEMTGAKSQSSKNIILRYNTSFVILHPDVPDDVNQQLAGYYEVKGIIRFALEGKAQYCQQRKHKDVFFFFYFFFRTQSNDSFLSFICQGLCLSCTVIETGLVTGRPSSLLKLPISMRRKHIWLLGFH